MHRGKLRSGRSCVDWKQGNGLALNKLRALARRMLADAREVMVPPEC